VFSDAFLHSSTNQPSSKLLSCRCLRWSFAD